MNKNKLNENFFKITNIKNQKNIVDKVIDYNILDKLKNNKELSDKEFKHALELNYIYPGKYINNKVFVKNVNNFNYYMLGYVITPLEEYVDEDTGNIVSVSYILINTIKSDISLIYNIDDYNSLYINSFYLSLFIKNIQNDLIKSNKIYKINNKNIYIPTYKEFNDFRKNINIDNISEAYILTLYKTVYNKLFAIEEIKIICPKYLLSNYHEMCGYLCNDILYINDNNIIYNNSVLLQELIREPSKIIKMKNRIIDTSNCIATPIFIKEKMEL